MPYLNVIPWETRRAQYRLSILIVVLVTAMVIGWMFAQLLLLAEANQITHQQQRNQYLIAANVDYQNTTVDAKHLIQKIDSFNNYVEQLENIKRQSTVIPTLLNFVAVSISDNITLTELSLNGHTVSMKGNANDSHNINAFITTMSNFKLLDSGRMVNLKAENMPSRQRKFLFHLSFKLAPDNQL